MKGSTKNKKGKGVLVEKRLRTTGLNEPRTLSYDIGNFNEVMLNKMNVDLCLKNKHKFFPSVLPIDSKEHKLSQNILSASLANEVIIRRTYLTRCSLNESAFCIPFRLFNKKDATLKSFLALPDGYSLRENMANEEYIAVGC